MKRVADCFGSDLARDGRSLRSLRSTGSGRVDVFDLTSVSVLFPLLCSFDSPSPPSPLLLLRPSTLILTFLLLLFAPHQHRHPPTHLLLPKPPFPSPLHPLLSSRPHLLSTHHPQSFFLPSPPSKRRLSRRRLPLASATQLVRRFRRGGPDHA